MLNFIKTLQVKKSYKNFLENFQNLNESQSVLGINYQNEFLELFVIMNNSLILFKKTKNSNMEIHRISIAGVFEEDIRKNPILEHFLTIVDLGVGNNNKENTIEDLARAIQKYKNYFNITYDESFSILMETMQLNVNQAFTPVQ